MEVEPLERALNFYFFVVSSDEKVEVCDDPGFDVTNGSCLKSLFLFLGRGFLEWTIWAACRNMFEQAVR